MMLVLLSLRVQHWRSQRREVGSRSREFWYNVVLRRAGRRDHWRESNLFFPDAVPLLQDGSLLRIEVRLLLLHESSSGPVHLIAVWRWRYNVMVLWVTRLRSHRIHLRLRIVHVRLHRWLIHALGGKWHAHLPMRIAMAHEMLVLLLLLLLRNALCYRKLVVATKVMRRCSCQGRRLAEILEGRVGMCARVLLHLTAISFRIWNVVQVDIPKLEQIVQVVQLVRHLRHCVEARVVHGGVGWEILQR